MKPDCIISPYSANDEGYAHIEILGKKYKHHRIVYCESNSVTLADIAGLVVRHTCDVPNCINPEHLVVGTQKENAEDRDTRGRNGFSNFRARISTKELLNIRDSHDAQQTLAARYAVSHVTIGKIKACKGAYSFLRGLTNEPNCV